MSELQRPTIAKDRFHPPFVKHHVSGILRSSLDHLDNDHRIASKIPPDTAKLWAAIPAETRKHLLSDVWGGKCQHEVRITNYSGTDKGDDILLVGKCSLCQIDVAKVIESN